MPDFPPQIWIPLQNGKVAKVSPPPNTTWGQITQALPAPPSGGFYDRDPREGQTPPTTTSTTMPQVPAEGMRTGEIKGPPPGFFADKEPGVTLPMTLGAAGALAGTPFGRTGKVVGSAVGGGIGQALDYGRRRLFAGAPAESLPDILKESASTGALYGVTEGGLQVAGKVGRALNVPEAVGRIAAPLKTAGKEVAERVAGAAKKAIPLDAVAASGKRWVEETMAPLYRHPVARGVIARFGETQQAPAKAALDDLIQQAGGEYNADQLSGVMSRQTIAALKAIKKADPKAAQKAARFLQDEFGSPAMHRIQVANSILKTPERAATIMQKYVAGTKLTGQATVEKLHRTVLTGLLRGAETEKGGFNPVTAADGYFKLSDVQRTAIFGAKKASYDQFFGLLKSLGPAGFAAGRELPEFVSKGRSWVPWALYGVTMGYGIAKHLLGDEAPFNLLMGAGAGLAMPAVMARVLTSELGTQWAAGLLREAMSGKLLQYSTESLARMGIYGVSLAFHDEAEYARKHQSAVIPPARQPEVRPMGAGDVPQNP